MHDYHFLNLSPSEFEDLSRDLLQRHFDLYFESFSNSYDGGVDFRHSRLKSDTNVVVQCKRYQDFQQFSASLRLEVPKVAKLKPTRYIITTSVGLNPSQKKKIFDLFAPHILDPQDIFGRDDLNNLLGLYQEIERKHFKLWLSSSNILDRIVHSKIYNQSNFEEKEILNVIKLYVENGSFEKAFTLLENKRYVIISGIPGIGKTTLARILIYHFLANGCQEFIAMTGSVADGITAWKDGVSQVFLFDDFLGRRFLDKELKNNEDQQILAFIKNINKSPDKILIMTTREYILSQAKMKYDIFADPALEFAKCILDISLYTPEVRAKILFNHLFFANLGLDYLTDLLQKKTYLKIIEHKNYSPRIIETITSNDSWKSIAPTHFSEKFIEFLDNPESIWKHVYENQISKFSQCVLACILTSGTPIAIKELKFLTQTFAKTYREKYGVTFSELDFNKSIRELENTFLITKKDSSNLFVVDYQNPSVEDFLVNYFKYLPDFTKDLIEASVYFNQLFSVFSVEEYLVINNRKMRKKNIIVLKGELKEVLIKKIIEDFDRMTYSALYPIHFSYKDGFEFKPVHFTTYTKLHLITNEFLLEEVQELKQLVLSEFQKAIIPLELRDNDLDYYLDLLQLLKDELTCSPTEIMSAFADTVFYLQDLSKFQRFEKIFPAHYLKFVTDNFEFRHKVMQMLAEEADTAEDYLEDSLNEIALVGDMFKIDYSRYQDTIQERLDEKGDGSRTSFPWRTKPFGKINEKKAEIEITDLFDSLLFSREE